MKNLFFDENGNEQNYLSSSTFFEITGDDYSFVVWEQNNSEEFKTLEEAIIYVESYKLSK